MSEVLIILAFGGLLIGLLMGLLWVTSRPPRRPPPPRRPEPLLSAWERERLAARWRRRQS